MEKFFDNDFIRVAISIIIVAIFMYFIIPHNHIRMCYDYGELNTVDTTYLRAYDMCIYTDNKLEIDKNMYIK